MSITSQISTLFNLVQQKINYLRQSLDALEESTEIKTYVEDIQAATKKLGICSLKYTLPKVCGATEPTDPGGGGEIPDISGWEEVNNDLEITDDGDISDYTPKFR